MATAILAKQSTHTCQQCSGNKYCVFSRFDQALRSDLSSPTQRQRLLHKGDKLYASGDDFLGLYIVKSGSFKSVYYDTSGDQQITGFHFTSDLLGTDGIQSGQHRYEMEALETATVCPLPYPRSTTLNDIQTASLLRQITSEMSRQSFQDNRWLLVLGRLKADQRLARFLLTLSEHMAELGRSDREFSLSMSRLDIANHLGIANETVSRIFKRFETDGWVRAERRWVQLLNKAALQGLMDSEFAAPLPRIA